MKPIDSKIVRKGETGGASRYFAQFQPDAPFIYASKASRRERSLGCEALPGGKGPVMNDRCVNCGKGRLDGRRVGACCDNPQYEKQAPSGNVQNNHPTVKSQQLMRYMLKLVVPPNGVVLDCFAGSGSTLVAAISEKFHYIGIEQEQEYIDIINARIAHAISEKNKEKIA
jgi:site-specific DNA-methyltransferase (adenine-specific)